MRELRNFTEIDQMSNEAARFIEAYIMESLQRKSSFSMILSGGSLLKSLYRALFYIDTLPWDKIHFFITDEKCHIQDNCDSNFKSAVSSLLKRSNIPLQNIHWINTDIVPLKKSVQEYEKTLKRYLAKNGNRFDLLLLSLGPDGHVASLFPGYPALLEKKRLVVLTEKSLFDPRVPRITMTLQAMNRAEKIMFFISDENCRTVLNEIIFRKKDDNFSYPAELVSGVSDDQIWFILRSAL